MPNVHFSLKKSGQRAKIYQYIEYINFFEVNSKYISSSVLKTTEFSDVFNSRDEIYLVFTENK